MTYSVKELFYTLQGEGAHSGRPAVFCRFAGCNLWSGREKDRAQAICDFCDTDFVGTDGPGGGKFDSAEALADAVISHWPDQNVPPYVVCTGGEPALQLDQELVNELHRRGCVVAIETNGTLELPDGLDWVCVSPKKGAELVVQSGDELKLVFPQGNFLPEQFSNLAFEHFYLQPMDDDNQASNIEVVMDYCRQNPQWKLSLQTHKILGIP